MPVPPFPGFDGIQLDFGRDFCDRHREPLRARWPVGAAAAMMMLFQAFAQDERVWKMCGYDAETGKTADAERLKGLVAECSPLCCFVGDEVMAEIMAEALGEPGTRTAALDQEQP